MGPVSMLTSVQRTIVDRIGEPGKECPSCRGLATRSGDGWLCCMECHRVVGMSSVLEAIRNRPLVRPPLGAFDREAVRAIGSPAGPCDVCLREDTRGVTGSWVYCFDCCEGMGLANMLRAIGKYSSRSNRTAPPAYYLGEDGSAAWDAIENYGLNYNRGCAWKYLVRAGRKTEDPRQDLRKAIACIEREIHVWESSQTSNEKT